MIDETDKKLISLIQGDLPMDPRPFAVLAKRMGISEEAFLERIRRLKQGGVIRRFGATLRHEEAGYNSNAMVAWLVPEDRIESVANTMVKFRQVTHCYHRRPSMDWKYNFYTMIHAEDRETCHRLARRMSEKTGIKDYILLFSEKEFKKTSMEYF